MEIYIEDVENGAEYNDKVYDFWIKGHLKNGNVILVFDFLPFDLRKQVSKFVECLIVVSFIGVSKDETSATNLSGTLIDYLSFSSWINVREDVHRKKWYGIETSDGVFLVNPEEVTELGHSIGDRIKIEVGRYDLVGIK